MASAVIAISFCYGAYMGEVFRAGILSVPKGQTEAARSLGFNNFQTMTLVILPQAMRTILPPIGNECIAMLKDTSLVSIIAVADLLRRGREFASQTFDYFETYTVIALVYLIITLLLSKGVSMMEGRLTYYDRDREVTKPPSSASRMCGSSSGSSPHCTMSASTCSPANAS